MESGEGLPQPPVAEAKIDAPVLGPQRPPGFSEESKPEALSPLEKGNKATTNAIGLLEARQAEGFFSDKSDLKNSAESVLKGLKTKEDGVGRVLDSTGLRDLASTLSQIDDEEATLRLQELKEGMIVQAEGMGDLSYDEWQEKLKTASPAERTTLEDAVFGYPKDSLQAPTTGISENSEEENSYSEDEFLNSSITTLRKRLSDKKENGEDYSRENQLLIAATTALEANGPLGIIWRSVAVRELSRDGLTLSEDAQANFADNLKTGRAEFMKRCLTNGISPDKTQEALNIITEGSFKNVVLTLHNLGLSGEVFGKNLTNENIAVMFGGFMTQEEINALLSEKDKKGLTGLLLIMALIVGEEFVKTVKGG